MATDRDDEIESKKAGEKGSKDREDSSNEMGIEADISVSQSDSTGGTTSGATTEEEIIIPPH